MTDEAMAPEAGAGEPVTVITPADDTGSDLSVSQAAKALAAARHKPKEINTPVEQEQNAPVEYQELADEANADPSEDASVNDPEAEQLPPIERPRSWSKDDDDDWNALPRNRQEKIAANERARETDIRQRINEAAEIRKAAEADRIQVSEERKALAAKVPQVEAAVQDFLNDKYPDIRSMDDVQRMARQAHELWASDPFAAGEIGARLKAWEVDQQKIALALSDARQARAGEEQERLKNLVKYRTEETEKLAEHFPEIKDPEKLKDLTTKAIGHLKSFDFTENDLERFASEGEKPFLFSAGFQRLLMNSMKFEAIQKAKSEALTKHVPQVQRPGVSRPANAAASEHLQALTRKLEQTGSLKDAQALRAAQAAASSRRAS